MRYYSHSFFFKKEMEEFYEKRNKKSLIVLLRKIREVLLDFLTKEEDAEFLSDEFVYLCVNNEEEIFNKMISFEPELSSLTDLIDVGHPEWTKEMRDKLVKNKIELINKIIKKYS